MHEIHTSENVEILTTEHIFHILYGVVCTERENGLYEPPTKINKTVQLKRGNLAR